MTVNAPDIVLQMFGSQKIGVILARFVTIQTPPAGVGPRHRIETNDFGDVAATFNMGLSRSVAAFAALPFDSALFVDFGFPVRTVVVTFVFRSMTGRAYIAPDIKIGIGRPV